MLKAVEQILWCLNVAAHVASDRQLWSPDQTNVMLEQRNVDSSVSVTLIVNCSMAASVNGLL